MSTLYFFSDYANVGFYVACASIRCSPFIDSLDGAIAREASNQRRLELLRYLSELGRTKDDALIVSWCRQQQDVVLATITSPTPEDADALFEIVKSRPAEVLQQS